jgi:hypothetical protein
MGAHSGRQRSSKSNSGTSGNDNYNCGSQGEEIKITVLGNGGIGRNSLVLRYIQGNQN